MTTINDLHDETMVEIITKLPIKDIFRSMPVSKSWCNLISTLCIPTLTQSPPQAIIYPRRDSSIDPWNERLPYAIAWLKPTDQLRPSLLLELCRFLPFTPSPIKFLDCCNGFLLFSDPSSMQYYVCNPATQQYVSVPHHYLHQHHAVTTAHSETAALVFDPHCRLLVIWVYRGVAVIKMSIFSLQTRQVDVLDLHLLNPISADSWLTHLVFGNGLLYATSQDGHLLKFDIKQPSVRAIELPKRYGEFGCIGMSQGRLHFAWDDNKTKMMVWVLRDEWVLKHTLDYLALDIRSSFSVYAFYPTSDVLFVGNNTEIYRYDPCTKKLENVCSLSWGRCTISWGWGPRLVFPYSVNLTALEVVDH